MAITVIDNSSETSGDLNKEAWDVYNATVTALLTQHSSAGAHKTAGDVVLKALFDANTILAASTDDIPAALTVAASRIVGRASTGGIAALTASQVNNILGTATKALDNLASVAINVSLISDTDDTDDLGSATKEWKDLYIDGTANIDSLVADTVAISAGTITGITDLAVADGGTGSSTAANARTALGLAIGTDVLAQQTIGIADDNLLEVDHVSPADDDYAKFTTVGLEGRSYAEVKTDLSLNNVENTAISSWAGSANITTIGTVTSGTLSTGAVLADVTMTLGSDVDADIYYRASNVLTRLAKGTGLHVLRMNAGATAPEWAAATGGVDTSGTPVDNDYAKFTDADTIEGRSYSEVLSDIPALGVDGTAGRILRSVMVTMADGTNASTLRVLTEFSWNWDDAGDTDNIAKGGTTGNYTLNAGGNILTVENSGLSGNVLFAFGVPMSNGCGADLTMYAYASGNDLLIQLLNSTTGASQDITVLVDTGTIYTQVIYITDA